MARVEEHLTGGSWMLVLKLLWVFTEYFGTLMMRLNQMRELIQIVLPNDDEKCAATSFLAIITRFRPSHTQRAKEFLVTRSVIDSCL